MQLSLISLLAVAATTSATYIPPPINGTSTPAYPIYTPTSITTIPFPISIPSPISPPSTPTPVYPIHTPATSAYYPTGTGSWKPSGSGTGAPSAPTYIPPFTGGAATPTHFAGKALGAIVAGGVMIVSCFSWRGEIVTGFNANDMNRCYDCPQRLEVMESRGA